MIRGRHGPYVHVEKHHGGCWLDKRTSIILAASFATILFLLLLSAYFVYEARSQLSQSTLAQESLVQANDSLKEETVELQNKLDKAEYMVSYMRLELEAMLKESFQDLGEEVLDPWETFWGFAWAVNTGEYDIAHSLANSSYQATCSQGNFIIAVKSSGVRFPSIKLQGLAAEPNLKVAVVFYTILPPDPDSGLLKSKMIPEEDGRFVFPVPSSFCGYPSFQDSSPPATVFQ